MLRKLMKHEFRATSRLMWPVFAGMLVLTAATRLSVGVFGGERHWIVNFLATIIFIGFFFGVVALSLAPMVVSAVRFRNHMLKDEGYLTLTLPVSTHQLLASKLIVSAVWYAAAGLALMLVFLFLVLAGEDWMLIPRGFSELFRFIGTLDGSTRGQVLLFGLELFLNGVVGIAASTLILYAAYAVGYSFNKHKSLLTVVFFLAFTQLVQVAAVFMIAVFLGGGPASWLEFAGVYSVNLLLFGILVSELAICAAFYFVTYFFLTRKLNLE